ncbi:MAG TPA: hypothetical protein VMH39_03395, partial [Gemmatimonadaceae bacterium]|nr:hypothetical protein [Gemmatimonadaceae bacterium]
INAALPAFGSTSGGMAIGTPAYMAPEQLAGDPEADARLDLYAVGLLAYELLTGVGPFTNLSPRETLTAQLTRDPAPLSDMNPAVPPALSSLVTRLLAKDPAGRPPNAEAVVEELDAMTMPVAIQPQGPAGRRRGARRALVGAAVAALVLLIAVAVTLPGLRRRDLAATAAAERVAAQAHADSVAKRKPASRPRPIVLTHADSIAIFERVNQQVEAAHMADSVASARLRDSLNTVETARQRDSLATVIATMTPRRVAVRDRPSLTGGWPDAIGLAQAVADSLRRALSGRREFVVLPPDSATGRGRGPPGRGPRGSGSGQFNRGAPGAGPPSGNLIVTVTFEPLPGDSALLRFDLRDPGAVQASARKELDGPHIPRALAMGGLDARLSEVIGALDEMAGAPRAAPPR